MKRLSWQLVIASLLTCSAAQSLAQQYPAKPIRIVSPYPPGGGTDVTARMLTPHLTERWGRPVIVDSRLGGAAMIGTDAEFGGWKKDRSDAFLKLVPKILDGPLDLRLLRG